jgi:hypothetical protein
LQVKTVRNTHGFAFDNYGYGWLSFGELTDLVGVRDMFIEVNPCWPFYSCPVPTGVPDPVAYVVWGVLNLALKASGGHCFGISRTVQELLASKVRYSKFAPGIDHPLALPSATGPNSALGTWLDGRHAGQGTAEFLSGYLGRERSIAIQLDRIRSELAAGRYPGVSMQNGFSGHVVTAYDIENLPDGSTVVYVYDNNQPFTPGENSNADGHYNLEIERSAIRINAAKSRWEFPVGDETWSGGDSDIFTVPLSLIPDDPSLPGLNALAEHHHLRRPERSRPSRRPERAVRPGAGQRRHAWNWRLPGRTPRPADLKRCGRSEYRRVLAGHDRGRVRGWCARRTHSHGGRGSRER